MDTFESKVGTINKSDKEIFEFLSDFRNFDHLVPVEHVQEWTSNPESCSFKQMPLGTVTMKLIEKEEFKTIKVDAKSSIPFTFWIQLKAQEEQQTHIKLTMKAELNFFIRQMANGMLKNMLNEMVDRLTDYMNAKQ